MKDHYDPWYVRLPDGRVIKAKSTQSVRYHVEVGHVPKSSMVRRHRNGEWTALGWTSEFADLADGRKRAESEAAPDDGGPKNGDTNTELVRVLSGNAADPMELETVGLRGIAEDLYAAFDCAIHRDKLLFGGSICGLALALASCVPLLYTHVSNRALHAYAPPAVLALVFSLGATWICRQTHWELSRMKPVSLAEGRKGSFGAWIQSLLALGIVYGGIGGLLYALGHVTFWLNVDGESAIGSALALAILVAKFALLQVAILGMFLGPIGPIEDYNFIDSLRIWRRLCSAHIGRIMAYESFAVVVGIIATLPLTLPLYFAGGSAPLGPVDLHPTAIYRLGTEFLFGMAVGPLFVFLTVANVILYLKLRYEFSANR